MLHLPVAFVEELVEQLVQQRYIEQRPIYFLAATYLNAQGGKDPKAKKLPRNRAYTPEELMAPWDVPESLRPLRFTPPEARAILAAIPHMQGANWVFQALINRLLPLDELERQAQG